MNMQITAQEKTIAAQRVRIEELEEELRQVRGIVAVKAPPFPDHWNLTPTHRRMLAAFAKSPDGFVSHEQMKLVSETASYDWERVLAVQILRLRRHTAYLGIKIVNRWGAGYVVPPESHAFIKAALAGEVE